MSKILAGLHCIGLAALVSVFMVSMAHALGGHDPDPALIIDHRIRPITETPSMPLPPITLPPQSVMPIWPGVMPPSGATQAPPAGEDPLTTIPGGISVGGGSIISIGEPPPTLGQPAPGQQPVCMYVAGSGTVCSGTIGFLERLKPSINMVPYIEAACGCRVGSSKYNTFIAALRPGTEQMNQLTAHFMAAAFAILDKPQNRWTAADRALIKFIADRMRSYRMIAAQSLKQQWEKYKANHRGTGFSALLSAVVPPQGFINSFDNPYMPENGLSGLESFAAAGGGIGGAGVGIGAVAGITSTLPNTSIASVAAGAAAGPIAAVAVAAAVLGTQVAGVIEYDNFNAAVNAAVANSTQTVDISQMASTDEGREALATFIAMMMINNAGA